MSGPRRLFDQGSEGFDWLAFGVCCLSLHGSPEVFACYSSVECLPSRSEVNIHNITHAPASDVFANDVYAQHAQCASAIAAAFT